ncbi:MAG: hypothetical protein ACO1O6_06720 [Bacteroidota bacterium]
MKKIPTACKNVRALAVRKLVSPTLAGFTRLGFSPNGFTDPDSYRGDFLLLFHQGKRKTSIQMMKTNSSRYLLRKSKGKQCFTSKRKTR